MIKDSLSNQKLTFKKIHATCQWPILNLNFHLPFCRLARVAFDWKFLTPGHLTRRFHQERNHWKDRQISLEKWSNSSSSDLGYSSADEGEERDALNFKDLH